MIYSRNTNFSYPVLKNNQNDYKKNEFTFDIDLKDNSKEFIFEVKYKLSSKFLLDLLENNRAELFLIIQSVDNSFYKVDINDPRIVINKTRLSLSKQTKVQLFLRAKEKIKFENNNDLNDFFYNYRESIFIKTGMLLAISDIVIFNGKENYSPNLFKTAIVPELDSEIRIDIESDFIIINYQKDDFQFLDLQGSRNLNNLYIYIGLQKALIYLINNNLEGDKTIEDGIIVEDINTYTSLEDKLQMLLISKGIVELNIDNLDSVISLIADKIVFKFSDAVRREIDEI